MYDQFLSSHSGSHILSSWIVRGVLLLLASTSLGQEHQDLLSLCDGVQACTD